MKTTQRQFWQEAQVREIAAPIKNALVGGPFGSNLISNDYTNDGIPVIRGTNMGQGRWVGGEFAFISEKKAQELAANTARPGDLVFTQRGTLGQIAIVPPEPYDRYIISQSQMKLTVDSAKADATFLYYFFASEEQQDYIRQNAIQTGVPHTNLGHLRNTRLLLPPLPEQRAIASVLGSLDDKIELNQRMNETLEALAQSLFKSWFVDATQSALPQGWRESTLGDVIEVKHGYAYQGEFFRDEPCRDILLTPGNFAIGGGFKEDKFKYYEGPTPGEYVISEGDLLITMTDLSKAGDTLGYGALIPAAPDGHRFHHNQRLGKVLIHDPNVINKPFLYQVLRSHEYRAEILGGATGTTVKHTSPGRIKSFKFVLPPSPLVQKFGNVAGTWHELAAQNRKESRTLAALRDTLLPKLLSGDLRVPF